MTDAGSGPFARARRAARRAKTPPKGGARLVLLLLLAVLLLPGRAWAEHVVNVTFPSVGASASVTLRGTLYHPRGPGPFPAVVLLHGCDGVIDLYHKWAARFAGMGYVALIVDSFKPRGLGADCRGERADPPDLRVEDAMGARAFLAKRDFVDPARIAVIGWDDGGDAALRAVGGRIVGKSGGDASPGKAAAGFRAAAAFYPDCAVSGPFAAPVLVLVGDQDRWSPVAPCARMIGDASKDGASPEAALQVYPGATHLFDDDFPTNAWLLAEQARGDPDVEVVSGGYRFLGHMIRYDEAAHDDAIARLTAFLAKAMPPVQAASGQ